MRKKPLIVTNPYLRTPEKYREALVTNVSSSTAIETGAAVESIARKLGNQCENDRATRSHVFRRLRCDRNECCPSVSLRR